MPAVATQHQGGSHDVIIAKTDTAVYEVKRRHALSLNHPPLGGGNPEAAAVKLVSQAHFR